jgi:CRISPR-associated endonuclease/helicase Cas3
MPLLNFDAAFEALTGNAPFPWQRALYCDWFAKGAIPASCNLPTGLGKTRVMAIWLIALANGAKVPRRLVYVVNRRTVVDQATRDAMDFQDRLKKPAEYGSHAATLQTLADRLAALGGQPDKLVGPLGVSTLRGQLAESRQWWENPARPAIVIGTIDLIGSRLLFQGYRAGLNRRPVFAAFLGHDALLVHDEAHLEPAFQKVVEAVQREQGRENSEAMASRRLRVTALTATPRGNGAERGEGAEPFRLTQEERVKTPGVDGVRERLFAEKGVKFHAAKRDTIPETVVKLALRHKNSGLPILVFVRTVRDVDAVRKALTKKGEGVGEEQVQILTGTIRGHERDRLATHDDIFARFVPDPKVTPKSGTVYLVCTSAGEVGVDLSAAHLVCDLTPLDSVAQRFGRVNRRGAGPNAEIDVVYETDPEAKRKDDGYEMARWATRTLLADPERLAVCDWDEQRRGVSPAALGALMAKLTEQQLRAAFTPEPVMLDATDILFDSWALTTISKPMVDDPLPGRPPVAEYLHGVEDDEQPDTQFAWRAEVSETGFVAGLPDDERKDAVKKLEKYLAEYPLKPQELLTERTYNVVRHLKEFAKRGGELPAWVVDVRGGIEVTTIGDLAEKAEVRDLIERTIVFPPTAGGLTREGLLDPKAKFDEVIQYDVADLFGESGERPRVRFIRTASGEDVSWLGPLGHPTTFATRPNDRIKDMTRLTPFVLAEDEEENGRRLVAFVRSNRPDDDDSQSQFGQGPVPLKAHLSHVEVAVTRIVDLLRLPHELREPLIVAARFHDLGKDRKRWQRAVGNYDGSEALAKSGRGGALLGLEGYRHEFGSLVDIAGEKAFTDLPPEQQDLVLHLIAAHHGRGRPHFPSDEAFDPERRSDVAVEVARAVPQRFARLQRRYGRWGLAYLESLLRAADALDSKRIEETLIGDRESGKWPRPTPSGVVWATSRAQPKPTFSVNVDPTNPGQFFACCGLLELADRLWPDPGAEGWFADGKFHVTCEGTIPTLFAELRKVGLSSALTPELQAERESLEKRKRELKRERKSLPKKEETRRKELGTLFREGSIRIGARFNLLLDWWQSNDDSNPKTWAGSQAVIRIAGAALTASGSASTAPSPFDYSCIMRAADEGEEADEDGDKVEPFYFDARRCPNAHSRDVGFSPNDLDLTTTAHPAVELLCLVGLQRCLPAKTDESRIYDYFTWSQPLAPVLLPAAVSGLLPHLGSRGYRFENWFRTGQRKHKAFRSAIPLSSQGAQ